MHTLEFKKTWYLRAKATGTALKIQLYKQAESELRSMTKAQIRALN